MLFMRQDTSIEVSNNICLERKITSSIDLPRLCSLLLT